MNMKKLLLVAIACLFFCPGNHTSAIAAPALSQTTQDRVFRNSINSRVGSIDSDGTIRNARNSHIGTAPGINKQYAAAFFFFFFD
jgi:hypothetical protein